MKVRMERNRWWLVASVCMGAALVFQNCQYQPGFEFDSYDDLATEPSSISGEDALLGDEGGVSIPSPVSGPNLTNANSAEIPCVPGPNLKCFDHNSESVYISDWLKPNPQDVYVYPLRVPKGPELRTSRVSSVRSSSSKAPKLIVISATPGDTSTANKGRCAQQGVEVSSVSILVNPPPDISLSHYCILEPGRTYYVNFSSHNASNTQYVCDSPTTCGHRLQINGL